ncbi:methyl-accepting chemotaxis protein [Massilia sp. S19_KUP03_FR1]|uniref:methyl-accepting chemotaxis protein n=1 Tax=Massilia sp. S19_KUP03_FR1 TaxID=3025503 RepID=UPI002FCD990B
MKFANLKIARRLQLAFGLVIVVMLVTIATALSTMDRLNDASTELTDKVWPRASASNAAALSARSSYGRLAQLAVLRDPAERAIATTKLAEHTALLNKSINELDGLLVIAKGKALNAEAKVLRDTYLAAIGQVLVLGKEDKMEEASKLAFGSAYAAMQKLSLNLTEQSKFQEARFGEINDAADVDFAQSRNVMIGASLLAVLLSIAAAIVISRSIVRPLEQAVKVARTVAGGDLTSEIDVTSNDETGQLMQALKEMNTSLQTIIGEVRTGSDTIASASSEIASGNLELSSRTEQQASSLEETASSMEEMTSTVKQNADNARQANVLAASASDVARKGGAVVSQVVETMGAINDSSRKIVDIISVIDSIAFQTNILALNAAVEAARAGEQGRGFAVVASEVRNLAQRSASAAKEIKTLIDDSVQQVTRGSKLVHDAGSTMEEVVTSVQRVTDIMAEISSASREQEAGIEQINMAITEMDSVTQQNAALVEEAAAAAGSLEEQSTALAQLVSRFVVHVAKPVQRSAPRAAMSAPAPRPASAGKAKPPAARIAAPAATVRKSAPTAHDEQWETF